MIQRPSHRVLILFSLACLGLIIYGILDAQNVFLTLQDGKAIQRYIASIGLFGPIMIVLLMTLAIMVSPLPSAPIAIAAGAVYGHTWGTVYVLIGSVSGATGAFFIARYLGHEFITKLTDDYIPFKFFESQNALMGIVFVSRLMPFLSFDVISYAAGLSSLVFWRFVVATVFGIAPASFFLAHVGSEMASAELDRIAIAILLLTSLTGISLLIKLFRKNV
jgi:uncharacterized membrane protein YdjX (TVP38/TMEM64 family)